MAASTLLFAGILAAILGIRTAPVTPAQDGADAVKAIVDRLKSEDLVERDAAAADLRRLTLDRLPLLESALDDADSEVAGRVREAVADILAASLSRAMKPAELRALADPRTLKTWQKAGADKASPPDGYEVWEAAGHVEALLVRKSPVIEAKTGTAVAKAADRNAMLSAAGGASVELELTEAGEAAFAEVAANANYLQVAVICDGRLLQRATLLIRPNTTVRNLTLRSQPDAERLADALNGKLRETSFLAAPEKADAARPEAASLALGKAFGQSDFLASGDAWMVRVPLEVKSPNVLAAWRALRAIGWTVRPR